MSVSDNGVGIRQENLKKLAEPFTTIDEAGLNKEGIGLGLYIVNSLIRILGPSD